MCIYDLIQCIRLCNEMLKCSIIHGTIELNSAMNDGALQHLVTQSYALDEIIDAHESMESNKVIGNIVIDI